MSDEMREIRADAELLASAERHVDEGKWDAAIESVKMLTKKHGDFITTCRILGDSLRGKEKYDEAIEQYQKGIDMPSNDTHSLNGIIDVVPAEISRCHIGIGRSWYGKGENEKALEFFRKAESLYPGSLEKWDGTADQMLAQVGANLGKVLQASLAKKLESYESDTKEFREKHDQLVKESEEWQKKLVSALRNLSIISVLSVALVAFMCWLTESYTEPLGVISWLAAAGVILAPFVWRIRILDARRHESLILAHGFLRKAIVEERVFTYAGADEETRRQLLRLYVEHWMEKSPLEVLLTLRGKEGGRSFMAPMHTAINRIMSGNKD